MINTEYLINVSDYMPEFLPRPQKKQVVDRAEDLNELPIIQVSCVDGDYYNCKGGKIKCLVCSANITLD